MQRILIILGLVVVIIGIFWPIIQKIGPGHLPGDIVIERKNFRIYFPIATMLLISVIVSLVLWLIRR